MRHLFAYLLLGGIIICAPVIMHAALGVGVGTGKIEVKESLKSGGIYTLPEITVFNTGTETATYAVAITQNETQPQLKPRAEWFSFSEEQFTLPPQGSQTVTTTIRLPVNTVPGNYFAYLEAHPVETAAQGSTNIGIAAASKLSFTIAASNMWYAIMYRVLALFHIYAPWSYGVLWAVIIIGLSLIVGRFIKINIHIEKQ